MPDMISNAIWVWMDCRSSRLFGFSLNILAMARELAAATGGQAVACVLAPKGGIHLSASEGDACGPEASVETACLSHGADQVLVLEHDRLTPPRADLFAHALCEAVRTAAPRLVLAALTDFGRELAARAARHCRAGLIADCQDITIDDAGRIVGVCPAWGGNSWWASCRPYSIPKTPFCHLGQMYRPIGQISIRMSTTISLHSIVGIAHMKQGIISGKTLRTLRAVTDAA